MERRAFLALIASAPIAALAPLPKPLPLRTIQSGDQCVISNIVEWTSWEKAMKAAGYTYGPPVRFNLRTGRYID